MSATMEEFFDHGGEDGTPGNETKVDALGPPRLKMKTADNATVDNVNPIPKPASALNYSFWKQVYLKCSVKPADMCNNFKWYTDGSGFGTGISLKVGNETPIKDTEYEVATGDVGESGNEMVAAHATLTGSADAFSFTSSAEKTVTVTQGDSKVEQVGETTNYIVIQAEVGPTAGAGTPGSETCTWKWDEI